VAPVTIIGLEGIGEVNPGDDVASLIIGALGDLTLEDSDVVVVTHKIVSKAEGRIVELTDDGPDAHRRIVESEAKSVLRRRGDLVIAETHHGFICANAGVDRSNAGAARAVLLPIDPDFSANRIRRKLGHALGVEPGVIITDTFGRPWRRGLVDVAIGAAGIEPITDLRGEADSHGKVLEVTEIAIVDEIAAAADLVMGKASRIPVAIVSGVEWRRGNAGVISMLRPAEEDLFR